MINSVLNRNKKKSGISELVDQGGNVALNPVDIADKFNEYFSNIAWDLKSITNSHSDERSYEAFLNGPVPLSIFLRPADHAEIIYIIKNLKNKSTINHISRYMLKYNIAAWGMLTYGIASDLIGYHFRLALIEHLH